MGVTFAVLMLFLFLLIGVVQCDDSSSEELEEAPTTKAYFEDKVKALNIALYYILLSLEEDLVANKEIDISFLETIHVIIAQINAFDGEVEETNALMLGALRRNFPEYLLVKMQQKGIRFENYTEIMANYTTETTKDIEAETVAGFQ